MAGVGIPRGLQVVKRGEPEREARYTLDEEALSSVLLREDVRDREVVVVSVAGTYRSGKSFLLDVFLRYLTATRSSQLSGDWLDIDRETLEGFEWRGGGDRHTTGIHLWSEPALIDLPNGKKVAVLLMDTQGTFDSESTISNSSTIFALSTLISSVQIYNIAGNIREDDLAHLQLFTEYGRLASEGKAFQSLIFLVRDWMYGFEHSYGFEGGQELLQNKLQSNNRQPADLRDVRDHIKSCFDSIKCFLMPHPGLAIAHRDFAGCMRELREEFRDSLLELVPALFDPENFSVKLINTEPVKAKHLVNLFKTYVDIFNSDAMPGAISIFQTTAELSMVTALRDASEVYQQAMDSNVHTVLSAPTSCLEQWHNGAKQSALQFFRSKKKLSSQKAIDDAYDQLAMELEARLATYSLINDAKTRASFETAERCYYDIVEGVCKSVSRVCMHPADLEALHERASQEALDSFSATRVADYEDEEWTRMEEKLRTTYIDTLLPNNESNNLKAIYRCRELYTRRMWRGINVSGGALSSRALQRHHETVHAEAVALFHSHRNVSTLKVDDIFSENLLQEIADQFKECEVMNQRNVQALLLVPPYTVYNSHWAEVWRPRASCFHPDAMLDEHHTAKDMAVQHFLENRPVGDDDDENKNKLSEELEKRFADLQVINNTQNVRAVELAFKKFQEMMDKLPSSSPYDFLILPYLLRVATYSTSVENAKKAAISLFNSKRLGDTFSPDTYLDQLTRRMQDAAGYNT